MVLLNISKDSLIIASLILVSRKMQAEEKKTVGLREKESLHNRNIERTNK